MSADTQCAQIKAALEAGRRLTPLAALKEFGCLRLGARIWDLKREGVPIERELIVDPRTKKRFAEYRIAS